MYDYVCSGLWPTKEHSQKNNITRFIASFAVYEFKVHKFHALLEDNFPSQVASSYTATLQNIFVNVLSNREEILSYLFVGKGYTEFQNKFDQGFSVAAKLQIKLHAFDMQRLSKEEHDVYHISIINIISKPKISISTAFNSKGICFYLHT